jgi:hypothetical protein
MHSRQWLTEKHFLICPKGVMFKQMKVNSQKQVRFSGHLAATVADTMIGNAFMCMGIMAVAAPPVSILQAKAVAKLASPALGLPRLGIPPQLLAFASNVGTMKCNQSALTRKWVNPSQKLRINGLPALVVGQSTLLCPSEAAIIEVKETFWEAVMLKQLTTVGHLAPFSFMLLAARGLGTLYGAWNPEGKSSSSTNLPTMMNMVGKLSNGMDLQPSAKQLLAQGPQSPLANRLNSAVELSITLSAAKGETLTCFPAGTLVHSSTGLVPIERIEKGQLLWTKKELSATRELKPVQQRYVRTALKMVVVQLVNGTLIELTADHRVFSQGQWVRIETLGKGDLLENIIGEQLEIQQLEIVLRSTRVYNLSVVDNPNYFVLEEGILVHNATYQI